MPNGTPESSYQRETPYKTGERHQRWAFWESYAEDLRQRLAKHFPDYSATDLRKMPPWDMVVSKAQQIEHAFVEGGCSNCLYGVWPGKVFDAPPKRYFKKGPMLFRSEEKEFGPCWLAPNPNECGDSCFSSGKNGPYQPLSPREVMWVSKDVARWYIMRMVKEHFRMDNKNCKGILAHLKLEVSHLCHVPQCLNPMHLNFEQHGAWYSKMPIYPSDLMPGLQAHIPRWESPGLNFPTREHFPAAAPDESPEKAGPSQFDGSIGVTPGGSQSVRRSPPNKTTKENTPFDVSIGCGRYSGNVDRICCHNPILLDKKGYAAIEPCPHTPACLTSIRSAKRVRTVDKLKRKTMQKLGFVVGKATEAARAFYFDEGVDYESDDSVQVDPRKLDLDSCSNCDD